MVKLSSKGRYAVRAMSDLAFHGAAAPAQIREVARRQKIPLRFLEQIFQDLRRAGLVVSKRGPRGGYQLGRAPAEICVGDVLRALDGAAPRPKRAAPPRELRDVTDQVLEELAHDVETCFRRVTLEDVCARGEEAGLARGRALRAYAI